MVYGTKEEVFNSKVCFIQMEGSKRLIPRGLKIPDNVYVLKGSMENKNIPREDSSSSDFEWKKSTHIKVCSCVIDI